MGLSCSKKWVVAAMVVVFGPAGAAGCADESDPPKPAEAFRCRTTLPSGGCYSQPANCPVTIPHGDALNCPLGADLIPVTEDDCAQKFICTD